jgi:hypothetical protein
MSSVDPSVGASGDAQALAALGEALDRLDAGSARHLAEVAILVRAFPRWAVWVPASSATWTAARPAGSMLPGPEAPMVWVRAGTAGELAGLMRAADAQISPDPCYLDAMATRRPAREPPVAAYGGSCRAPGCLSPLLGPAVQWRRRRAVRPANRPHKPAAAKATAWRAAMGERWPSFRRVSIKPRKITFADTTKRMFMWHEPTGRSRRRGQVAYGGWYGWRGQRPHRPASTSYDRCRPLTCAGDRDRPSCCSFTPRCPVL